MNLLSTSQLNVQITDTQICNQLNLQCQPGEVWGILGRNGKGKTTLLHTLAGLRPAQSGEIFLQSKNINQLSRREIAQQLGILLQHHEDSFPSSVIETVMMGRHPHLTNWQWETDKDLEIAQQVLEALQLHHLAQRSINQLSGGERQRVAIATLLTQNPQIMLLDEPNSHLDIKYQIQILDYLSAQARQQSKLMLLTIHDLNLAARYCDKLIMLMGHGEVLQGDAGPLLSEENLYRLYDFPIRKMVSGNTTSFIADPN